MENALTTLILENSADELAVIDFTIVTASYNYGQYIEECLESVASQREVTYEHLVMDAGSADDTAEIVARFPGVSFYQEPDKGMSDGINKGFRKARGKWVMWLNADDRLKPGALRAVKKFGECHSDADVIYGGWDFVDTGGKKIRSMSVFPFQKLTLIYLGCYIGSTSTFFKRKTVIDEGHFLNDRFKVAMDSEFYCRLATEGKRFHYFHALLADFRIHGENISLRNYGDKNSGSVDQRLNLELQFAESRAIKRAFGFRFTGQPMLDTAIDSPLFYFFWIRKAFSKRLFKLMHPLINLSKS